MSGTIAVSWGPSGGFYLHRRRVCLGCLALTYVPHVEIDDLMEVYVAWARVTIIEQDDIHWRASMTDVRWTTSDRGLRYYAEAEGHEVHESSAAASPHLWVDDAHLTVEEAAVLRDELPAGPWRDTLTTAIEGHYQTRIAASTGWKARDPCTLCGSTDTGIEADCAFCKGCGAYEGDKPPAALDDMDMSGIPEYMIRVIGPRPDPKDHGEVVPPDDHETATERPR